MLEDMIRQTVQDTISESMRTLKHDLLIELRKYVIQPQLLNVNEAAKLLAVSRATIYELMECGELPSVWIGRARRIPTFALKAYVERKVDEHEKAA